MISSSRKIIPARIRQARESRGYTMADLADLADISKQAISQYELGKNIPSDAVLLKLSCVLNYPISFFEKEYTTDNLSSSPIFFRSRKTTKVLDKKAAKAKISIFKEITDYFEQYLDFPDLKLPEISYSDAQEILSIEKIEEYAMALRKCWDLGDEPIPNLLNVVQKNGIMVSSMKIGYKKIDAFSVFKGGRPYIFLSSDKESNAKMRFSVAHELGHIIMHSDLVSEEDLDKRVIDDKLEYEANIFAAAFLLPEESFSKDILSSSIDYFVQLKRKWLSSIASMIYRCENLEILSENQIIYLKRQMTTRKYWKKEPFDDIIQLEKPFLCKQAIELLLDNFIVTKTKLVDEIGCYPEEIEEYCFLEYGTLKEKIPDNVIQIRERIKK